MAGSKSLSVYSLDEATTHFAGALALLDKNQDCASDAHLEQAIIAREKDGYIDLADWSRLFLVEVLLQIVSGKEKLPFRVLLKNLPTLLKVMATASSRIRDLDDAHLGEFAL
jgi:hypothetical protein